MGDLAQTDGLKQSTRLDSTTYEVDDFEAVPLRECCVGPCCARDDLAVVLDGYAVTLESEFGDEVVKAGGLRQRCEGAGLAVENKGERHDGLSVAGTRLVCGSGQGARHPLAEATVGFRDLLAFGEDGALEAHEDVDSIGVGLAGGLIDEEHAGAE